MPVSVIHVKVFGMCVITRNCRESVNNKTYNESLPSASPRFAFFYCESAAFLPLFVVGGRVLCQEHYFEIIIDYIIFLFPNVYL